MTALKMALVALVASLMLALGVAEPASAQVPSTSYLPVNGGIGLLTYIRGGSMLHLAAAAQIEGCSLEAVWRGTASGEFLGYIYRAPEFVNASFVQELPNGELPANSPLMVRCAKPAVSKVQGQSASNGCAQNFPEIIRRLVLLRMPVPSAFCVFRYDSKEVAEAAGVQFSPKMLQIYNKYGGVGVWTGTSVILVDPSRSLGLEAHELCHSNQQWHSATVGKARWEATEAATEFRTIGQWRYDAAANSWTSIGLEKVDYKETPTEAAAEVCRIMLNPDGRYTQVEIDAMVPAAYQAWAYKWVIVR